MQFDKSSWTPFLSGRWFISRLRPEFSTTSSKTNEARRVNYGSFITANLPLYERYLSCCITIWRFYTLRFHPSFLSYYRIALTSITHSASLQQVCKVWQKLLVTAAPRNHLRFTFWRRGFLAHRCTRLRMLLERMIRLLKIENTGTVQRRSAKTRPLKARFWLLVGQTDRRGYGLLADGWMREKAGKILECKRISLQTFDDASNKEQCLSLLFANFFLGESLSVYFP